MAARKFNVMAFFGIEAEEGDDVMPRMVREVTETFVPERRTLGRRYGETALGHTKQTVGITRTILPEPADCRDPELLLLMKEEMAELVRAGCADEAVLEAAEVWLESLDNMPIRGV